MKTVGRTVDECVHDVLALLADNEIILRNIADDYGGWYSANQGGNSMDFRNLGPTLGPKVEPIGHVFATTV